MALSSRWRDRKASALAVLSASAITLAAAPALAQAADDTTFALALDSCMLTLEPASRADLDAEGWIVAADLAFGPMNRVVSATRSDAARGDIYLNAETTTYGEALRHSCTVEVYGPTLLADELPSVAEALGLTGTFEPVDGGVLAMLEGSLEGGFELVRVIQFDGYFQLRLEWVLL